MEVFMKRLFVAAALGYIAGTLLAPRKGSELRAQIKDYISELQGEGAAAVQRGEELVAESIHRGREIKAEAAHRLAKASASVKQAAVTASDSFSNLERNADEILKETLA
jgi:gas vesicle protein